MVLFDVIPYNLYCVNSSLYDNTRRGYDGFVLVHVYCVYVNGSMLVKQFSYTTHDEADTCRHILHFCNTAKSVIWRLQHVYKIEKVRSFCHSILPCHESALSVRRKRHIRNRKCLKPSYTQPEVLKTGFDLLCEV